HEETGLLVPDGDVPAMADAVRRLCGDPRLAERLSVNGRELALRSAWESVRPQWENLFAEVMANNDGAVELNAHVVNSNSLTTRNRSKSRSFVPIRDPRKSTKSRQPSARVGSRPDPKCDVSSASSRRRFTQRMRWR